MKAYNVYYYIKMNGSESLHVLENVKADTAKAAVKWCKEYVFGMTGRNAFRPTTKQPAEQAENELPAMTEKHKTTLYAWWDDRMNAWQLYYPYKPLATVAYVNSLEEPRKKGFTVIERS